MSLERQHDLIIVGAGLVGSALACALAGEDRDLRIALLEAGPEPIRFTGEDFDPRVSALTPRSEALLRRLGAWDVMAAERLCPFTHMDVWDGEGTGRIHFSAADIRHPHLGHIVENSQAVLALQQRLAQLPGVELIRPAQAVGLRGDDSERQLQLDNGDTLSAPLIVAADGANSRLRQLAGFQVREWAYGQRAIVTRVRCTEAHRYTAWQRFMHTGPLAFLPLRNQVSGHTDEHHCSIVWSADEALADTLMALDEESFRRTLADAFEHRLGDITACDPRLAIPLHQRHATDYARPGVVLVGDAAHSIHPLAGQGVNLGLLDADALAAEILRARQRSIPLSDISIGRRYQRQRLGHNLAMMGAMEGFKRLFGSNSLPLTLLRNTGMTQLDSLPLLKQFIVRQAMGAETP